MQRRMSSKSKTEMTFRSSSTSMPSLQYHRAARDQGHSTRRLGGDRWIRSTISTQFPCFLPLFRFWVFGNRLNQEKLGFPRGGGYGFGFPVGTEETYGCSLSTVFVVCFRVVCFCFAIFLAFCIPLVRLSRLICAGIQLYLLSLLYVCGRNAGVVSRGGGEELLGVFVCFIVPFRPFPSIPKLYSRGSKIRGVWVSG